MLEVRPNILLVIYLVLVASLSGCMKFTYVPSVYDLPDDRIAPFSLVGSIDYENMQTDTEIVQTNIGGHTWSYDLNSVTSAYIDQFKVEVEKKAEVSSSQAVKKIKVLISELRCEKKLGSWVRSCTAKGWLKLGNGEEVIIDSAHRHPMFIPMEDVLDGMTAIAVQDALNNKAVLDYLKS